MAPQVKNSLAALAISATVFVTPDQPLGVSYSRLA
jgi:hypothetical protein